MSTPFLGIYLTSVLGFSLTQSGLILATFPFIIVLLSGIVGSLTDRLALRTILLAVAFFWGRVYLLFFFATTFWHFLLLNSLNGCCYALFEPTAKKLLARETAPEDRLLAYNIRYAAINLGGFLGPLLSQLFHTQATLVAYLALGGCYLLYGLVLAITIPDTQLRPSVEVLAPTVDAPWRIALRDVTFVLLLAGVAFSYFGYSQFNSTLGQYLTLSPLFANGPAVYAYVISLNSACILVLQFALLQATKKLTATTVLLISNLLLASSVILCGLAQELWGFLLVSLVYSLGELLLGSRFDTLVDALAPDEAKGTYFGFAELIKIGSVLGPIVGGHLLTHSGVAASQPVFIVLGLITLTGSLLIYLAKKTSKSR